MKLYNSKNTKNTIVNKRNIEEILRKGNKNHKSGTFS